MVSTKAIAPGRPLKPSEGARKEPEFLVVMGAAGGKAGRKALLFLDGVRGEAQLAEAMSMADFLAKAQGSSQAVKGLSPARLRVRAPDDRAIQIIRELKEAEGGAWSTADLTSLAKISRQSLQERRQSFTIAYWTDAHGHCHYPVWQFDASLRVLPQVREILGLLKTHDSLKVLTTFLVPMIGDPGISVLSLIREGKGDLALDFVRGTVNER